VAGVDEVRVTGNPEFDVATSGLSDARSLLAGVAKLITCPVLRKLIVLPIPTAGANVSSPFCEAVTTHAAPARAGIGVAATRTDPVSVVTI
jgi:hypothetical protein